VSSCVTTRILRSPVTMAEPDASTDYKQEQGAGAPTLMKSHEGEHHGDFGDAEVPITRAVKVFAFCAAINSCNLGYDIGVSTTAAKLVQEQWALSDSQREFFVGTLNFFSIFGALSSHFVSDRFGRRTTFVVAAVAFIVGLLFQSCAPNYTLLLIGRALVGLGCGVGLAVSVVLWECIHWMLTRYSGEHTSNEPSLPILNSLVLLALEQSTCTD
jgi:Sugar (and other) transporter